MPDIEVITSTCDRNDDPAKAGRIMVTMPLMGGNLYPEWVEPIWPGGTGVWIPEPGDVVEVIAPAGEDIVEFADDVRYIGQRYDDAHPVPDEFKVNYPHRRGFKTKTGHVMIFDDKSGSEEVTISYKGSHLISLTKDGIFFGTQSASEPMVLGNLWKTMMDTLFTSYVLHTHPTGVGPSGPPSDAGVWSTEKGKLAATISDFIFGQKTKP